MKISITRKWCAGLESESEELLELFLMSVCKMKNILIEQDYSCSSNLLPLMYMLSQQQFVASDAIGGQLPESYKVTYKPYQNGVHQKIPVMQEGARRNEVFEDVQHEFLGNDESKCLLFRLEISLCEKSDGNQQQNLLISVDFLIRGQLKVGI